MADFQTGKVLAINAAYTALMNITTESDDVHDFVEAFLRKAHKDDQHLLQMMFRHFLAEGQPFELTWRHNVDKREHRLTGRGRFADFSSEEGSDNEGRKILICVIDDTTTIDESGAIRSEYRRHIDDVSKLKSAIIENIGHEFRTPVTAIMGFSDLLESRLADDIASQYVTYIRNSSQRLLHTLESILEYAVIYSGSHDVFNTEIQLEDLLEDQILILQQMASEKGLYLQPDIQPGCTIYSDKKKLASIIFRYVDNAVKFTNEGGIRLKVHLNDEQLLKITVSDTGIGIKEELADRLFEPFRVGRANREVTRVGIGMGLSIVKRYSNALGGKVWLETNEYGGTTAGALIPVKKVIKPQSVERTPSTNRKRILYVEDNNILQLMMSTTFPGVQVDKALNAEQALELIRAYTYPLVFIDINLGSGMDGAQLCKHIRGLKGYHDSKLIAATANHNFASRELLERYGFDDFLLKPLNINAMRKMVEQVME